MRTVRFFSLFVLLALLSGCASMEGKFNKTKNADIGIFADQTVAMLSEGNLGVDKSKAIYTRDFIDPNNTEMKQFLLHRNKVKKAFINVVKYSLRLVAISEGYSTEAERVQAYADYLESFNDTTLKNLELSPDHYAELISDVRKKEKFIEALQVAQPMINSAGRYVQAELDLLEDATGNVVDRIEAAIDEEYVDIVRYQRTLHDEKYALLKGVELLYQARINKSGAYEELKKSGTVLDTSLLPDKAPDYAQRKALGKYFHEQFQRVGFIEKEIQPDWDLYRATHRELDKLHASAQASLNRSRVVMIVWLRAHQKMASGKINPAAWFDLSETPSTLFQLGKSAIL